MTSLHATLRAALLPPEPGPTAGYNAAAHEAQARAVAEAVCEYALSEASVQRAARGEWEHIRDRALQPAWEDLPLGGRAYYEGRARAALEAALTTTSGSGQADLDASPHPVISPPGGARVEESTPTTLPPDWRREGMVVVCDSMTGQLLGSMGIDTWRAALTTTTEDA